MGKFLYYTRKILCINKNSATILVNTASVYGMNDVFYQLGEQVAKLLNEKLGIKPTLVNPRYITGLDKDLLNNLQSDHQIVITLEDGILQGGFGEKIASFYGCTNMKVKNYGIEKTFPDRYDVNELLKENEITVKNIVNELQKLLDNK